MQGPHGSQDQAPGSGRTEGKAAVSSTHACQDKAPAELLASLRTMGTRQPCPLPALPAHGHWHLWDTGRTSQKGTGSPCGEAAAVPACTVPPLYNHEEPAQTCAFLHGAGWDPAVPDSSPTRVFGPPGRSWGCSPSEVHCQPLSPDGMETCQSKSPACRGGQGLCATASELGVGVEATGRGACVGTPCSPAVCGPQHPALTPSHSHLLVSGSEINSR